MSARVVLCFLLVLVMILCLIPAALAADKPLGVNWMTKDTTGAEVRVPAKDRPTVLVFIRHDQPQSRAVLDQLARVIPADTAQVLVVLSGPQSTQHAMAIKESGACPWPTVADTGYTASGQMSVHVWPTTVVVQSNGQQVAHLAGNPKTFASHFAAYLDLALGRIDEAALKQRLENHEIIGDSPEQMASRHLQVTQRLLDEGRGRQALAEASEGLRLAPQDTGLQLAQAKALLLTKQPKAAMAVLEKLPASAAHPWQLSLLRGRALVAMEQWDQAKATLPAALKLNPNPAEAHYLLGLVYRHEQQWAQAAEEFRQAFETTDIGRRVTPASQPAAAR